MAATPEPKSGRMFPTFLPSAFHTPSTPGLVSGFPVEPPAFPLNAWTPTTPFASAPMLMPNTDIKIELENGDLWRKFHQNTTEMIVNKTGRRMFPTLRFRLSGLEAQATYAIFLDVCPQDDCRYKFQNNRWVVNGRADPLPLVPALSGGQRPRAYAHPDSPAPGHLWMRQPVSFHRLKLTNNILDPQGNMLLNSMHKYQPRLYVVRLHDYYPAVPQLVACATFPETAFVTVTAYQNEKVIQLKIDHNPFAKGFRDGATDKLKTKRSPSPDADLQQDCLRKRLKSDASNTNSTPLTNDLDSDRKTETDKSSRNLSPTGSSISNSTNDSKSALELAAPPGASFLSNSPDSKSEKSKIRHFLGSGSVSSVFHSPPFSRLVPSSVPGPFPSLQVPYLNPYLGLGAPNFMGTNHLPGIYQPNPSPFCYGSPILQPYALPILPSAFMPKY